MAQTTTGAVAAAPEGGQSAFPPFATESFASQLLWFALAFGLLYYLMSRVLLPRIGAAIDDRTARLARDIADAHRLKAESEVTAAAHEKALADARADAKAIAQERRNALNAASDSRRKALEAELAERLHASEAAIRSRTAEAMGNVRGIAAEAASAIVERLTGRAPERVAVESALDRINTR